MSDVGTEPSNTWLERASQWSSYSVVYFLLAYAVIGMIINSGFVEDKWMELLFPSVVPSSTGMGFSIISLGVATCIRLLLQRK